MNIRSLAEVGVRLEEAVSGEPSTPQELYERYEMLAIQILDSEFDDYADGILEEYLMGYLSSKRLGLGLSMDDIV